MEESEHGKEVSNEIRQYFEQKFPLEKIEFRSKDELLNYYVEVEKQLYDELDNLFEKLKPVPFNKMKFANNTLLENLIISFELNDYSKDVTKAIQSKYKEIAEQIVKDTNKIKEIDTFVTHYISERLNYYSNLFISSLSKKFNRQIFPDFLVSKFVLLIKNKYLTILSEKNIDVSYFYFSDQSVFLVEIYQDIFVRKQKFLFNAKDKNECTKDYFDLIILSNNFNLKKKEMSYLEHLIHDFKYFVYIFNLNCLYENKDFEEEYNINKLIQKYIKEYIEIPEKEAEEKKKKILEKIIPTNSENNEAILNIILSYTLILNYLVAKNSKTGEVELSMTDSYTSFASMKIMLDNTLNNFELILDAEEIRDFTQSVIIKDLFASQNYLENQFYDIDKIKELLTNNKRSTKLKRIAEELFKGLYTEKRNKIFEFILSWDQDFKDNNVCKINLSPLNPRVTSTHCYIFISGFLSETSDHYREWENMALNLTFNNTCYFYNWPGNSLYNAAGETILNLGLTFLSDYSKKRNDINNVDNINSKNNDIKKSDDFDPGKSFVDSSNKAALSGKILAVILASKLFFKYQTVTLVGFSLGAHIIKNCLKEMYNLHFKEHIPCNEIGRAHV